MVPYGRTDELVSFILRETERHSKAAFVVALLSIILLATAAWKQWQRNQTRLPDLPILKMSSLPGRAGEKEDIAAFVKNGKDVMQVGYERYSRHGQNYLMRTPWRLMFVMAPKYIQEMTWLPDSKVDNQPTHNEMLQTRYTMHPSLEVDQYYLEIIQRQLTRNLGPGLPDLVDEAKQAFKAQIGEPTDWQEQKLWGTAFNITTRTGNRFFFGKELASDLEFLKLAVDYSYTVFRGAGALRTYGRLLQWFPFLKPYVLARRTPIYREQALARAKLGPILEERIAKQRKQEKSQANDSIQWVLDITPPEKRDVNLLVHRLMHLLIVAVHTSSTSYLDCMNELAARPDIHNELREEIRHAFLEEGGQWRKQGLNKLVKLDSFMRETVRFNTNGAGQLDRVAMSDTTLSDGTFIPKGTYITVPSVAMNADEACWENAAVFDPWRFCKKREEAGQETQHSFVQTAPNYLHFGHGRHACPGRFFAGNEIKVLLVLTLMNYEMMLSSLGKLPSTWSCRARLPNSKITLLFKKREEVDEVFRI